VIFSLGLTGLPVFIGNIPVSCFPPGFSTMFRAENPLKPLLILKKSKQVARRTSAPSYDPPRADSAGLLGELRGRLGSHTCSRGSAMSLRHSHASRSWFVTWDRDNPLVQKGWVTPQQGDTDRLNLQAREAAVNVARRRLILARTASVELPSRWTTPSCRSYAPIGANTSQVNRTVLRFGPGRISFAGPIRSLLRDK
jgi:hypothetical protein